MSLSIKSISSVCHCGSVTYTCSPGCGGNPPSGYDHIACATSTDCISGPATTTTTTTTTTTSTGTYSTISTTTISISTLTDSTTISTTTSSTTTTTTTTNQINPINFNNPATINNLLTSTNQDITACLTNCSNNGVCQLDPSTQKLLCACDQYFTGSKCNIDTRPCSYGPCLNNATCTNTNLTSAGYVCECNEFYTGANCETQIDLCQNETCSSNGKCGIVDNKPKCQCFQYYSGDVCQTQSQTLVTIKSMIGTTSIIAVALIIAFYLLILISDILKFLVCSDKEKYKHYRAKRRIFKPFYVPSS